MEIQGWRLGPKMAGSAWKDRGQNLPLGPMISTRHQSTRYQSASERQTTAKQKATCQAYGLTSTLDAPPLLTWLESTSCLKEVSFFFSSLVSSKLKYFRAKVRRTNSPAGFNICISLDVIPWWLWQSRICLEEFPVCLGNTMHRGAWLATVCGVAKREIPLSN